MRARPTTSGYWKLCRRKSDLLVELRRPADAAAWLASLKLDSAPPAERYGVERRWGIVLRDLGQTREADRHLELATAAAVAAGDAKAKAAAEVIRADVLISLGDLGRAGQLLSNAADAHRPELDPFIRHYRGKILWKTNRFEEAIGPLAQSAADFQKLGSNNDASIVLVLLGTCYYRLGRFDRAREIYEEALKLAPAGRRHLGIGHLGNVFFDERQFDKAAQSYREAADDAKSVDLDYHSLWLTNLASCLIEQKQWNEADRVNADALRIESALDSSLGLDHSRVNQALIAAGRGRRDESEQLLKKLLASPAVDLAAQLDANSALAAVYAGEGRGAEAERQYERALALADESSEHVTEDENKLAMLAALIKVHQEYVEFLMQRRRTVDALAVAEASRARLLRERLNLPRRARVRTTGFEYREVARAANATLLAYQLAPGGSWVWAITPSSITASRLPDIAEIRDQVERYQAMVEGSEQQDGRATGRKLFDLLVPPQARNSGRLLMVPDGPLYALNFETLPSGTGRYWIESATIAVTPSLDLLAARRPRPRRDKSLLVLGDAVQWDPDFEKLINARKEIEVVASGFASGRRTVLTEAAATPAAYLQSKPRDYAYIHFAAHATANRGAPMESAIILSKANGKGRLSVQDVLRTPVNADLVTISACRSAGARTYAGEGLVGLAWAFVQSGARDVIAGLWNVNDYASPKLMGELYAGLASGQSPAAALRSAKLKLIADRKFAAPYYWGALELFVGALPY